ncbi:fumarylacetoacetate hydrolase family protein, partial [Escherichia coli]|uniref:fumarylacetoacetate hydrolase family protein n=1 Tax=Escherichia coli TaxID=562 RepID=UPI0013210C44
GSTARFPVRRIYCIGRNYLAHIREMGEADERDPPIFFQKPSDALVVEGVTVPYPGATADYQYEAELVVAIGVAGADIAVERALAHVWGYAVGLDMTRRDLQRAAGKAGHPWENGKSFDHSAPCGEIVPVSE